MKHSRLSKTVCIAVPESHLTQVGVGVRWGIVNRDFSKPPPYLAYSCLATQLSATTSAPIHNAPMFSLRQELILKIT